MSTSATAVRTTSVLVVDDHTTFSDLLALALASEPDFSRVGTASSAARALVLADELRPDLVIMDVRLGDGDGLAATALLTRLYPDLRVVVLTAHADITVMQRAADAGACALLLKDGSLPDMLQTLRSSRPGGMVVHPGLLTSLMASRSLVQGSDSSQPLTRRERDVLALLADALDTRAIAKELGISVNTCRGYMKNVLLKLGAHSQLEAVVMATNRGLVSVKPPPRPIGANRHRES